MFERAGVPKPLRPLVGGMVNPHLIARNWTDILRIETTWSQAGRSLLYRGLRHR